MPNVFVFPGGGVDPQLDAQPEHASLDRASNDALSHLDWRAWGFSTFSEAQMSLRAALRETHEEAGLKLAPEGLQALNCVAHWLTPPITAKRYDTYFWAASCEVTQEVIIDGHEISDFGWWSPSAALEAYAQGEVDLAPPTFCLLTEMARHQDPAQYILSASLSPPPEAICPHLLRDPPQVSLCLPDDDAHPQSAHQTGTRHRLTRVDGRWTWDTSTPKPLS
jgi:8-oxo-dGTP pyrophosphatase MutT (NUDIX family)